MEMRTFLRSVHITSLMGDCHLTCAASAWKSFPLKSSAPRAQRAPSPTWRAPRPAVSASRASTRRQRAAAMRQTVYLVLPTPTRSRGAAPASASPASMATASRAVLNAFPTPFQLKPMPVNAMQGMESKFQARQQAAKPALQAPTARGGASTRIQACFIGTESVLGSKTEEMMEMRTFLRSVHK